MNGIIMNSISVKNFKSIIDSGIFELRPLTVLAGINSSGKSTLLQALLLLKQTIDAGSKDVLKTSGPYLVANEPLDVARGKKRSNVISISLNIDAKEFIDKDEYTRYASMDNAQLKSVGLQIDVVANGKSALNSLTCIINYEDDVAPAIIQIKRTQKPGEYYSIKFTSPLMVGYSSGEKIEKMTGCTLSFHSFLPIFAEWTRKGQPDIRSIIVLKTLETDLLRYLKAFCYIGPQREKPDLARSYDSTTFENVGVDGHNTRFLYEKNKTEEIDGYEGKTLQKLCNEWVCQKMGLARSMDVQRDSNKLYRTIITNNEGLAVDLCQMGFGLSQILPIVVQGLLLHQGETLIVEDPDVHMHPKVQAMLVDFFIDLMKHGRRIVIETHSDHIVTRLRRRIADGTVNKVDVNLSFVENNEKGSEYRFIDLNADGSFLNALPEGFLDSQENDFMAIIANRTNR